MSESISAYIFWDRNVLNISILFQIMTFIIYSDKYLLHDNASHPENASRLRATMELLQKMPFYEKLQFIEPSIANENEIAKVHSQEMIEAAKHIGWLDPDTYTNEYSYEVAKLAAGGVIKACQIVMKEGGNAFALIRPPGHHATRHRSMGFCLFNNAAMAANLLAEKGYKILIFDHDVHHGNGTQDIFYERRDVMYQSFHLHPHYPGTGRIEEVGNGEGEGYIVNAPLPHGTGEKCIEKLLDEIMIPIAKQFSPDLIIISAGFDSHHADYLGGLKLSVNFYGKIIEKFMEVQSKIVCCLEGGYNLEYLPKGIAVEIGHLCNMPIKFDDEAEGKECNEVIERLREVMKEYWEL